MLEREGAINRFTFRLACIAATGMFGLISGCAVSPTTATITVTRTELLVIEESITVNLGQGFTISLESWKQAGNEWYITFDSNMLLLMEKTYKPDWTYAPGEPLFVGGGGVESFWFETLVKGKAFILFKSVSRWMHDEGEPKVFEIDVK